MTRRPAPIISCAFGLLVGFLAAYAHFASLASGIESGGPEHAGRPSGAPPAASLRPALGGPLRPTRDGDRDRRAAAESRFEEAPQAIVVDWENERASLPLASIEHLDLAGFTSDDQSPWDAGADSFVISPELNAILQLDETARDDVRAVLLEARRKHADSRWRAPIARREEGDAVVIEIAPAPAELEDSIRGSLAAIMGETRADFFLRKVKPTLDWEFGGFGSARQVLEISVLPDDTLSIRESLRPAPGDPGARSTNDGQGRPGPPFEMKARQHRVARLPARLAALVRVEEAPR